MIPTNWSDLLIDIRAGNPLRLRTGEAFIRVRAVEGCNLRCVFCPGGKVRPSGQEMSPSLYEKIVQQAVELEINPIDLLWDNEPFLHRDVRSLLLINRKHRVNVAITTNGTLLEKHLPMLCDFKDILAPLRISIDGGDKESYERSRIGGSWEAVKSAVIAASKCLPVSLNFLVTTANVKSIGAFIKEFSPYFPRHLLDFNLLVKSHGISPKTFKALSVLDLPLRRKSPCYEIFRAICVAHDGDISPCPHGGPKGEYVVVGRNGDIIAAQTSDERRALQAAHATGIGLPPQCVTCEKTDLRYALAFSAYVQQVLRVIPGAQSDSIQAAVDFFLQNCQTIEIEKLRLSAPAARVKAPSKSGKKSAQNGCGVPL